MICNVVSDTHCEVQLYALSLLLLVTEISYDTLLPQEKLALQRKAVELEDELKVDIKWLY